MRRILTMIAVGIAMACLPVSGNEFTADYWRAKVSSTIAIDPMPSVVLPRQTPVTTPAKSRPVVYVTYAAFHCPPCDAMKAQSWVGLPFDLVPSPPKIATQHYPWVHWQGADGRWYYLEDWNGKADLVQRWRMTQKPVPKAQSPPVSRSYSPRWTWPGNLNRHLQDVHRVNTSGLNQDQLEALHDALHEGGKKH